MNFDDEMAAARGNIYGFLAVCYLDKPSAWMETLAKTQEELNLEQIFGNEGALLESEKKYFLATSARAKLADELFNELFRIPGTKYIAPYESCYRQKKIDGSPGNTWGCSTVEVQYLYRRAGAGGLKKLKELPDHFGVELAFMQYLCMGEFESINYKKNNNLEMFRKWQKGFLHDHLLQWSAELASSIEEKSGEGLFSAIAAATRNYLEEEQDYLV